MKTDAEKLTELLIAREECRRTLEVMNAEISRLRDVIAKPIREAKERIKNEVAIRVAEKKEASNSRKEMAAQLKDKGKTYKQIGAEFGVSAGYAVNLVNSGMRLRRSAGAQYKREKRDP